MYILDGDLNQIGSVVLYIVLNHVYNIIHPCSNMCIYAMYDRNDGAMFT